MNDDNIVDNIDDDINPSLPESCPHCQGGELYVRRISSGGGYAPYYLAGLGKFLHNAHFDVVVCADCGLTQFFAEPLAQRNVRNHPDWRRSTAKRWWPEGSDPQELRDDVSEPSSTDRSIPQGLDDVSEPARCLNCRSTIPAGADTCPQCGWTYKGEG